MAPVTVAWMVARVVAAEVAPVAVMWMAKRESAKMQVHSRMVGTMGKRVMMVSEVDRSEAAGDTPTGRRDNQGQEQNRNSRV